MSNKFPYQDGSKNSEMNRERQRYCHTSAYHTIHLTRENNERSQERLNSFKEANPARYADFLKKRPNNNDAGTTATGVGATTIASTLTIEEGATSAFGVAGVGALAAGAALGAIGLGTAAMVNHTILKDDDSLDADERGSRSVGRKASYAGGVVGAVGTMGMISASGSVIGLGGAGIASGVAAIGGSIGCGAVAGTLIVAALPAVAAVGAGYGVYKVYRWFINTDISKIGMSISTH